MDVPSEAIYVELTYVARMFLAALLGGLVGWEREQKDVEAGIRTYAVVSLAACAFSLISVHGVEHDGDPTRIAAEVISGMGFLGAGLILVNKGHITGLTTAATLWASASIGLAVGFGLYVVAVCTAGLLYIVLAIKQWPLWMKVTPSSPTSKKASVEKPKVIEDGEY
ncbi:MAG: MgtC/SapB family protein [Rickettsiales bacterium]